VDILEEIAFPINVDDRQQMLNIVNSCIGTKFTTRFGTLMSELALDAVKAVTVDLGDGRKDIDIKKYAKVEKIPGGNIEVRAPRASWKIPQRYMRAKPLHTAQFLLHGATRDAVSSTAGLGGSSGGVHGTHVTQPLTRASSPVGLRHLVCALATHAFCEFYCCRLHRETDSLHKRASESWVEAQWWVYVVAAYGVRPVAVAGSTRPRWSHDLQATTRQQMHTHACA
jgi:hypothetical protein